MIVRIWRHHHSAIAISRMQGGMVGLLQSEVDEAIVDEVDFVSLQRKLAVLISELARVRDDRLDAVLSERLFREHKLRIEILLRRPVIDDRDAARRTASALPDPFRPEHVDDV